MSLKSQVIMSHGLCMGGRYGLRHGGPVWIGGGERKKCLMFFFFSKNGWLKPSLEVFARLRCLSFDMDTFSLCLGAWYQTLRRTSFGFRPRSGHLQAVGCTRWLLDGCFTTKARTCTCRSSLHSSFFGNVASSYDCCIVQLLNWLVICVSRVTCDFVSRLGGRDTIFFQRTAD